MKLNDWVHFWRNIKILKIFIADNNTLREWRRNILTHIITARKKKPISNVLTLTLPVLEIYTIYVLIYIFFIYILYKIESLLTAL